MTEPGLEHVELVTIAQDHGQFYLYTDVWDEVDSSAVLNRAIAESGIAQDGPLLVILSPHQNNFALSIRSERWTGEPLDDLADWQEAFRATFDVGAFRVRCESTLMGGPVLDIPPGRYAVRITGRGFVQRGWPGSTKPGDTWRFQWWPCARRSKPARLKSWTG